MHEIHVISLITKTCLYNVDPLKPQFYIVKLGFTGVYIVFLISAQKHRLWVLVRTEAVLTSTHNLRFEQKYKKCQSFLPENFRFLEVKFSIYLNRCVFVMFTNESFANALKDTVTFLIETRNLILRCLRNDPTITFPN